MAILSPTLQIPDLATLPTTANDGDVVMSGGTWYIWMLYDSVQGWHVLNPSRKTYTHSEASANSTWLVRHNLNTTEVVYSAYDSNGHLMLVDLQNQTNNGFDLVFSEPVAGRAFVVSNNAANATHAYGGTAKATVTTDTNTGDETIIVKFV